MENKQKKQPEEKPLELVRMIAVNQINIGPHYEVPAEEYYKRIQTFEKLYNIKIK